MAWERVKLKRLFRIVNGSTPRSDISSYWSGDIVWVTPDDLGSLSSREIDASRRTLTDDGLANCGATLVPPGSLVLSTRAPIGHIGLATVKLATNQGCRALVPKNGVDSSYYYYALVASRSELKASGTGSTFLELSRDQLGNVAVPAPALDEQRAIAAYLDGEIAKIDALIEKKRRLLSLIEEKRTAVITRAVTRGLDADVPMLDSGVEWLGKIPAHWETAKVRHLSTVGRGASPRPIDDPTYFADDGRYGWVRIEDVTAAGKHLKATSQYLSSAGVAKSVPLESGALILSIAASVGKPIILAGPYCIHDGFVYFARLKRRAGYWYYIFRSGMPFHGLGKTGTQLNLNTGTVGDIVVPVPPPQEEERIESYLDEALAELDQISERTASAIALLQEYRTALIAAAVTGQIEVPETAA